MNFKHILIIRPDAIGDCVLITPAIKALKQRFPAAKISILAQELTKDLFTTNPNIEEVLTDITQIKPNKYDLSIHYYNELPYALAAKRAKIRYRFGSNSKPLISWLYNIKATQNWRDIVKHDVEQNMLLLKPLGIKPPYPKLDLNVDKKALAKVEKLLQENGIGLLDKIAGLHLSTGQGNKPWTPEKYGQIADYLTHQGYKVVVAGQAKEKELIKQAGTSSIIDLSTKTSLKELIALTSKYSLFVGVDTGPFHIAAAMGIPMVHISTSKFSLPLRWGPWQNRHVLVRKKSKCNLFCLPANCQERICAEEITVDEVKQAIDTLLAGSGNKNQNEARFDWCKKSFSIMITYKEKNQARAEQLCDLITQAGFYAIKVNLKEKPNFPRLFKENNTNIMHTVSFSLKARLQALISGSFLITPVLYVKDQPELISFDQLFDYYCKMFTEAKL